MRCLTRVKLKKKKRKRFSEEAVANNITEVARSSWRVNNLKKTRRQEHIGSKAGQHQAVEKRNASNQRIVEESFSARVPRSSAEVRRVFIHDIKEDEGVWQQEQQGDKREMRKEMK